MIDWSALEKQAEAYALNAVKSQAPSEVAVDVMVDDLAAWAESQIKVAHGPAGWFKSKALDLVFGLMKGAIKKEAVAALAKLQAA